MTSVTFSDENADQVSSMYSVIFVHCMFFFVKLYDLCFLVLTDNCVYASELRMMLEHYLKIVCCSEVNEPLGGCNFQRIFKNPWQ